MYESCDLGNETGTVNPKDGDETALALILIDEVKELQDVLGFSDREGWQAGS